MQTLWPIYHNGPVPFLDQALRSPALNRLAGVGMNCGCEYTSFPLFQGVLPYSRLDHSVGVCRIAYHLTGQTAPALAGLFHDIATPVFAHVIDFVRGDYLRQEATEAGITDILAADPVLPDVIARAGLSLEKVCEDRLYPAVNNETPRLSADRLEYTLGNLLHYGLCDATELQSIYGALRLARAGDGQEEICFSDPDTASLFGRLALRCSRIYVADEDRCAMQALAELIRRAMELGTLTQADLYRPEPEVIGLLKQDGRTARAWQDFTRLARVMRADAPDSRPGWRQIPAKKRWINPFVPGLGRLSEWDPAFRQEAEDFLSAPQTEWLLGVPVQPSAEQELGGGILPPPTLPPERFCLSDLRSSRAAKPQGRNR